MPPDDISAQVSHLDRTVAKLAQAVVSIERAVERMARSIDELAKLQTQQAVHEEKLASLREQLDQDLDSCRRRIDRIERVGFRLLVTALGGILMASASIIVALIQ